MLKHVSSFSCNSEIVQYKQIIHILFSSVITYCKRNGSSYNHGIITDYISKVYYDVMGYMHAFMTLHCRSVCDYNINNNNCTVRNYNKAGTTTFYVYLAAATTTKY